MSTAATAPRRASDELARGDKPVVALVACMVILGAVHLWLMRGTVASGDEVGWASVYRGVGTGVLGTWVGWFDPLGRLAYNVLFAVVGLESYLPFRLMGLVCNLALVAAVFWYCRDIGLPWAGTALGVFLLLFGSGVHTVLYPLNAFNALGMAALPAGLVLLARDRRSSDVLAFLALLVALGFAGPVVLPISCGLGAWLVTQRPVRRSRLWVPAAPALAYISATAVLPEHFAAARTAAAYPQLLLENVTAAPGFILEAASTAAGAVAGPLAILEPTRRVAVLVLAVVGLAVTAPRLSVEARRRVLSLGVAALAVWVLLAVGRGRLTEPGTSRYLLLGLLPMLLIGVEVAATLRRPARVVLLVALGLGTALNAWLLAGFAAGLRLGSDLQRARVTAIELAGARAPGGYRPARGAEQAGLYVDAGGWREAARHAGSFAMEPDEIARSPAPARNEVDRVLRELHGVAIERVRAPRPARSHRSCERNAGSLRELRLPIGGLELTATGERPVRLRFRRFADVVGGRSHARVPPGTRVVILPARDSAPRPWIVAVRGAFVACPRAT